MRLEHLTGDDEDFWRGEFAQQNWIFGALKLSVTLPEFAGGTPALRNMHFGYYLQPLHLNADDREDLPRKLVHVLARRKPPLDFLELSGAGLRIPHCFPKGFTLGSVLRITLQEMKRLPLRDRSAGVPPAPAGHPARPHAPAEETPPGETPGGCGRDARTPIGDTYDLVAGDYAAHIFDELKDKPFDRQLLDEIAERAGGGVICDLGCGPGQVARYLHERGADVRGVDLSPGMIERARALTPDVPFEVGDMRALDVPDGAWQGIVAFYAIVHFQSAELPDVFREMKRVLAPGGALLLSFHIGSDVVHRDEWWGHAVDIDFRFFQTAEVTAALEEGGLIIERVLERDPYPEIEYQSRRAYIVAVKPVE